MRRFVGSLEDTQRSRQMQDVHDFMRPIWKCEPVAGQTLIEHQEHRFDDTER